MAEEFETVELEYSEDDILYYIEDEDGNELGFALLEDGEEVEYYYEGFDAEDYETVQEPLTDSSEVLEAIKATQTTTEAKVEASSKSQTQPSSAAAAKPVAATEEKVEHGYLYKMAKIAGHQGNKTRKKAEEKLDVARGKAEVQIDKAKQVASEQAGKAKQLATEQAGKAKETADEIGFGFTREDITETTADLNSLAKEGAETAKELKEAYDDIMENFGFLVPKGIKRRLP